MAGPLRPRPPPPPGASAADGGPSPPPGRATLLLYLNDVQAGGATRFNRLGLDVAPRRGDALLFFPADARGAFDERLEHEGTEGEGSADKHVCRIWKHIANVPPPLGLGAAE